MTSYLLGVLASLDLPLLAGAALDTPIVVYGVGSFPEILGVLLPAEGFTGVTVVDLVTADGAAAAGAIRLYQRYRQLHG
jgi:hypothetical protein